MSQQRLGWLGIAISSVLTAMIGIIQLIERTATSFNIVAMFTKLGLQLLAMVVAVVIMCALGWLLCKVFP